MLQTVRVRTREKAERLLAATMAVALAFAMAATPTSMSGRAFADGFDASQGNLIVAGVKAGDTVDIYRVVNTTYDAETNTLNSVFADDYGVTMDDYIAAGDDPTGLGAIANTIAKAVMVDGKTHGGTAQKTVAAGDTSVSFDNLDAGQYLVVITPASGDASRVFQNTIASVEPTLETDPATGVASYVWPAAASAYTVTVKATDLDDPDNPGRLKKKVEGADSADTYALGDTVNYTVTGLIPHYAANAINRIYSISDTMSAHLDFQGIVSIKIDGATLDPSDYTYAQPGADGATFTITLGNDVLVANGGKPLEIKYSATVISGVSYDAAETNNANLKFSKDSYSPDPQEQDDPVPLTFYKIHFTKKAAGTSTTLAGAEFDLYKSDGTKVNTAPIVTGSDGLGSFDGLGAGSYYLIETKAPSGYDIPANPRTDFTVRSEPQPDGTGTDQELADITNSANSTFSLPTTGGPGTIVLTGVGLLIMIGAVAYLVRSRRRNGDD